jgi:vitamin K-dependent gamma-carboxylase
MSELRSWLAQPVDAASLALFRLAFGAILVWEVLRYFSHGWIVRYFVATEVVFKYPGFAWVEALPEAGMKLHFAALGVLGVLIALGVAHRASCLLFGVGFVYVFLLEQARYLNHFYLVILLVFLFAFTRADRRYSLARIWQKQRPAPEVPRWQLAMLRTQIAIVYVYAGIAKLNPDWLAGEPLRTWLGRRTDYPVIGPSLETEWMVALFSYGGLLLDLFVVPALLWRRTRPVALVAVIGFHLMNAWLFRIGIFPWLMIAATTLFLEPNWPIALANRMRGLPTPRLASRDRAPPVRTRVAAALIIYVVLQLTIPLRHHLYPGWVHWTEEGHFFSWRMMLREKQAHGVFTVTDLEGEPVGVVDPEVALPRWQANAMIFRPELIRQFAHHIGNHMQQSEGRPVQVKARISAALNGREERFLVDPHVDLSREPLRLGHAPWIRDLSPD